MPERKAAWLKPLLLAIIAAGLAGVGAALARDALEKGGRSATEVEEFLGASRPRVHPRLPDGPARRIAAA